MQSTPARISTGTQGEFPGNEKKGGGIQHQGCIRVKEKETKKVTSQKQEEKSKITLSGNLKGNQEKRTKKKRGKVLPDPKRS